MKNNFENGNFAITGISGVGKIEDNIRARNLGRVALNCHTIYSDGGEIFSNLNPQHPKTLHKCRKGDFEE